MLSSSTPGSEAFLQVTGLSGDVLVELQVNVGLTIGKLKEIILPMIAPDATESAQLMLAFDGAEPGEAQTLAAIGIEALEHAHFTALIYDPHALAMMELNAMHREAIERSRREAAEARSNIKERKDKLVAERRKEIESKFAARHEQPQGPLLMLSNEPANLQSGSENVGDAPNSGAGDGVQSKCSAVVLGDAARSSEHAAVSTTTRDWHSEASEVVAAYDAFFDHISFRKGWKQPSFTSIDAARAFATAARVVARTRIEILDSRDPGFKLRQVEGSARDWMHSPDCGPLLHSDPDLFIAGLVHATFKDAQGYVEGLSEREVDRFVRLYS